MPPLLLLRFTAERSAMLAMRVVGDICVPP